MAKLGLNELGISAGYMVLTCLIASILRKILNYISPDNVAAKVILQEVIAAWELCGCCFELIIVADNYGVWVYAAFLFLLTIWWSKSWGEATACPYTHIEAIIEGNSDWINAIAKTWANLTGGVIVYKYVQYLWLLDMSPTHKGRAFEDCTADLQVPALFGALIELVATCVCRVASRMICAIEPRLGSALDSFISTSLVVAAFNYSGGYFNPVLATALKFGCRGHSKAQHVVVYWLGSTLGAVLGLYVYRLPGIESTVKRLRGHRD